MIYFLVPMYNEESNLATLHQNLTSAPIGGRQPFFVFSDDGSQDRSVELVQELFPESQSYVVGDGQNYGPGHAFDVGFEWILQHSQSRDDIVVTMEADNTSDIGILPQMLTIYDTGFELVLASVYIQSGGFGETTFFRKFISFTGNMMLRLTLGIKVLTLSSFYRIYSLELLRKIKAKNGQLIAEPGFICMVEILHKAIRQQASIIEVPMTLRSEARVGKSKMKIFKTTMSYLRFMGKNMFRK
ncbi:MAG: glycosyltransferase [Bacteroidota bacterium]